jgi:preprotein translocase subunit SecA
VYQTKIQVTPERVQAAKPTEARVAGDGPRQPRKVSASAKIGRNDPCPCGSGKKYKNCCMNKE